MIRCILLYMGDVRYSLSCDQYDTFWDVARSFLPDDDLDIFVKPCLSMPKHLRLKIVSRVFFEVGSSRRDLLLADFIDCIVNAMPSSTVMDNDVLNVLQTFFDNYCFHLLYNVWMSVINDWDSKPTAKRGLLFLSFIPLIHQRSGYGEYLQFDKAPFVLADIALRSANDYKIQGLDYYIDQALSLFSSELLSQCPSDHFNALIAAL